MPYSYEVDSNLVLRIWESSDKSGEPVLVQPEHPFGFPWPSAEVAADWAKENYSAESPEEGTTLLEDAE